MAEQEGNGEGKGGRAAEPRCQGKAEPVPLLAPGLIYRGRRVVLPEPGFVG